MDFLKDIVKEIGDDFTQLASDIDETELLGVTVFKVKKENRLDIRYWPPIQGPGGEDNYYTDLNKCIIEENMNKSFLNLPKKIWKIFNDDVKKERIKNV